MQWHTYTDTYNFKYSDIDSMTVTYTDTYTVIHIQIGMQ
jgi:hypothetical protein